MQAKTDFKQIDIEPAEVFPFRVSTTLGIHSKSTMLHRHDCIEVCYIKQGTGMYLIGGRNHSFDKGDIFIINSQDIHLAYNDKNVIMQIVFFKPDLLVSGSKYLFEIEYLKPYLEAGVSCDNKLNKNGAYYQEITETLSILENEYTNGTKGFKLIIKSILLRLSSLLIRQMDMDVDTKHTHKRFYNNIRLQPVFEYIKYNYFQEITHKVLADLVNMSESNFSLTFKNTTGVSPIEYVIRTRVLKAAGLLENTDTKIIDIAMDCGFKSIPNFIKSFKKYTGMLPKEYRNLRK